MDNKVPESFYIYRELLTKVSKQREQLKKKYQAKIENLSSEVGFLKEQIEAQNTMIEQTVAHIEKLETQFNQKIDELPDGADTSEK